MEMLTGPEAAAAPEPWATREQNTKTTSHSTGRNTESKILTIFGYFLAPSAAKNCEKKAVIQSAASAASTRGGCASSRLDHGSKFYVIRGGCASSRLISEFSG